MANEKRLIDANAINYRKKDEYCGNGNSRPVRYVFDEDIEELPTVDAVEVVLCANCQYWNLRYETMGMCMKHNSIVTFTKPDFYCAWGKGKNDGICKED